MACQAELLKIYRARSPYKIIRIDIRTLSALSKRRLVMLNSEYLICTLTGEELAGYAIHLSKATVQRKT
jgi:hypothetical protein